MLGGEAMASERIQKILAQHGLTSRRRAEDLIREGSVTVNGKVAVLGDKADLANDSIKVGGKLLHSKKGAQPLYYAFSKPSGVLCAMSDAEGRDNLGNFTQKLPSRVFPMGRLDFNTDGLLFLTNDGELLEKFQKNDEILRIFHVKVKGHPEEPLIKGLARGLRVERKSFKPLKVRVLEKLANKTIIEMAFHGHPDISLKEYFETKGFLVEKMTRVGIGHLKLGSLLIGQMEVLKKSQIEALFTQPELAEKIIEQMEQEEKLANEKLERAEKRRELLAKGVHPRNIRGSSGNRRGSTNSRLTKKSPRSTR